MFVPVQRLFAFFTLAAVAGGALMANVTPSPLFADHAVLQRGKPVPVFGTGTPGEKVTVVFQGQTVHTTTDAQGRWLALLEPLTASSTPAELTIKGKNEIVLRDVLVGEVWLCSGQSNMDFTVAKTEKYYFCGVDNEAAEIAAANHPRIRMFTGEWTKAYEPQASVAGTWRVCTPETVREFSAVGYFFARALQQELDVPVGIVTMTFGASCAQAWIRREAIAADPRLLPELKKFDAEVAAFRADPEAPKKHSAAVAQWDAAAEAARAAGTKAPRKPRDPDPVQDQHNPTVMFNGMVAAVVPYALRGFLWYQGESITAPKELFPVWNETLIRDWRTLWGAELPFYFVQLAAHKAASNSPEVREMQTAALALPRTGMAVTIDIGDFGNVHPKNKQDVGARLARLALARDYGRRVADSGPAFASAQAKGDHLRLRFTALHGGLVAKGGALTCFEIAGADGAWTTAEAVIDGETVVVKATSVTAPVKARYAWSNYPENPALFNAADLPAAPFRTDAPASR